LKLELLCHLTPWKIITLGTQRFVLRRVAEEVEEEKGRGEGVGGIE
jgi:hypothetical protein